MALKEFEAVSDVSAYAEGLSRCISRDAMVSAYQQASRGSRLFAYSDILLGSCREYFRGRNGVVYVHDGRVWKPISQDVFRLIVRDAFIRAADNGSDRVKGDWVSTEKKLLDYAYSGACSVLLPFNPMLVGFVNGVWDFSDVDEPRHIKFSERPPVVELLPYKYDEKAVCPVWDSFLHTMLPERDIRVLQKFFGLGCVDRKSMANVVEESLWLVGAGANGKSTIERVLMGVFGKWNVSNTSLDSLLDRNVDARMRAMASVEGRMFNICEEISGTDIERGSDMFKGLVSGSPQPARGIGRDIWTVYDVPFLLFSMNQIPQNKRMDDAFRRRMVVIRFRSSVRAEDMDRGLASKLVSEYSGIRNWALRGVSLLADDLWHLGGGGSGLDDETVDTMLQSGLTVDVWKEAVGISASRHVGHDDDEVCVSVRSCELYSDYSSYCKNRLLCEPCTQNQFGRDMSRLFFKSVRKSCGKCYEIYCDARSKFNNQKNVVNG